MALPADPKAKSGARPSEFNDGYVDVDRCSPAEAFADSLEVGELRAVPGSPRCTSPAVAVPLSPTASSCTTSSAARSSTAALRFPPRSPGDVSPIILTLFGNDWFPVAAGHVQGETSSAPGSAVRTVRSRHSARGLTAIIRKLRARRRRRPPIVVTGAWNPIAVSSRHRTATYELARDDDRSSGHSVACRRRADDARSSMPPGRRRRACARHATSAPRAIPIRRDAEYRATAECRCCELQGVASDVGDREHLDRDAGARRDAAGELERLVAARAVDDVEAADGLLRLGEGPSVTNGFSPGRTVAASPLSASPRT